MTCKRCGRNVPVHSKVCPSCGLANPDYRPRQEDSGSSYSPYSRQQTSYSQPYSQQQTRQTTAQQYSQQQTQKSASNTNASSGKSSWKTILVIAVVVILAVVLFKNCGSMRLKGTWTSPEGESITFVDGKTGYISQGGTVMSSSERTKDFTYHVDGDELEIKTETTLYSYGDVMRFEFEISGDKLTLTEVESGQSMVFYKD